MASGRVPVFTALRGHARRLLKASFRPAFRQSEILRWLEALRRSGVTFGFPEDLETAAGPFAILKHDIHDDLHRAAAMAHAESAKGIYGIYFMLGPHRLNASFYGTKGSWARLRAIQNGGHRIGLHFDVADALERGGVYQTLAQTVKAFAAEGIALHYGNSHGNTQHPARGLRASDVFAETATIPEAPYSLATVAREFGLRYWIDNRVLRDGAAVAPTLYVTDNNASLRIPARGLTSARFKIDAAFAAASLEAMRAERSLILLHPQWYRAGR